MKDGIERVEQESIEKKQFEEKIKVLEQKQTELEYEQKKSIKMTLELDKMFMQYFEDLFKKVFGDKLAKINL